MKKLSLSILAITLLALFLFTNHLTAQSPPPNPQSPSLVTHHASRNTLHASRSTLHAPLSSLLSPPFPAHFWLTQRLTSPSQFRFMGNHSLALDAVGRPHIVYGLNSLYYAWHDGANWHREIVDLLHPNSGGSASLALDTIGRPHIVYLSASGLLYAYRSGNQWAYIELHQDVPYSASPSITLDSLGYPHIAFAARSGADNDLIYVHQTATGWFYQTIGQGDYFIGAVSLALDETNNPHISYIAGLTVSYASWTDNNWQIETLDVGNSYSTNVTTSIALDTAGRPAIAYQARTGIRFASRSSGTWSITALNNDVYGEWLSLALDANNIPHLSYYDSHQDGQIYATRPADTWLMTAVDTEYDAGRYTSLALDTQGRPHISYGHYNVNNSIGRLRYAHLSGNQWTVETIDTGAIHLQPRLAIDSTDRLHTLYQESITQQWFYTYEADSGWLTEATPITTYRFDPTISFIVDASGNPHLSYHEMNSLHYAYRTNNQWINQVIPDEGHGGATSLALDQNQNPHIAFTNLSNQLRYAHLVTNIWITETVDSSEGFSFVSLTLDSQDQPHIVYQAPGSHHLKYAHWQGNQWLIETLDPNPVSAAALVLDSQDRPHIAYHSHLETMEYLHWLNDQWLNETVAEEVAPPRFSWNYLALDSNDQPHIAYRTLGDVYSFVNYAYRSNNNWVIHNVGNRWLVQNLLITGRTSLVLDSQDNPFILDLDVPNGHVMLSQLATDLTYSPLILKP